MHHLKKIALVSIVTLIASGAALAAPTPEQACQAAKSKAAGKYALCRQGAEGKLATTGDVPKYTTAIAKCGTQFTTAWQKAIDKAMSLGAACPDSSLTASDYQTIINAHTSRIAGGISGVGLEVCSTAPRLRTGQTSCYDSSGAGVPCAATGHDGELQKGIARNYTDNNDGTITDNITGLMWEKLSDDGSDHDKDTLYTWTNAFAKVAALNTANFGGHNDWRLPNVNELESLINYAATPMIDTPFHTGCLAACTVDTCSCTKSGQYWTSTTYIPLPDRAWHVDFGLGLLLATDGKTLTNYARAVRDSCFGAGRPLKTGQVTCFDVAGLPIGCETMAAAGQDGALQKGTARSYTDNGNGTITDNNTGLTWEKLSNDNTTDHDKDTIYLWADAFTVKIANLNTAVFAGRNDWRLPNINELQSLVNYDGGDPAIAPIFKTACPGMCTVTTCSCTKATNFYWSSTTREFGAFSSAWGVFFGTGNVHSGMKIPGDFVRAVSGGS